MLAGAWILVLLPLMSALYMFEWASFVRVPNVFNFPGAVRTLDETLLCDWGVYPPVVFCMGVVLLFSNERGRRRGRLDWTRRWGVLCSYVVLLLSAAELFFIAALVSAGIAAAFLYMPLRYQPRATQLFIDVSTGYLRYGAHPMTGARVALVAGSSITILLACVPLFDALRSSGSKRAAAILLAPLALFSLMHLAQIGRFCLGFSNMNSTNVLDYGLYFRPALLIGNIASLRTGPDLSRSEFIDFVVEVAKWCIVLAIAVWLTIGRLASWRQPKKASAE
jgi:hypothetical protein